MTRLELELWDTDCRPDQVAFGLRTGEDSCTDLTWIQRASWVKLGKPDRVTIEPGATEVVKVVAIEAGCAECHSPELGPLIESREFASVEDAKAHYAEQGWPRSISWGPHPQGGEYVDHGQGSVWIQEIS